MDKIMAFNFNFPNGNMFCVGADWAIQDLLNSFIIQGDLGNSITFHLWRKRILNNQIYCRFEPRGLRGINVFLSHFFTLKKHHLWLTRDAFNEAVFFAHPEKVKKILGMTDEDEEKIKNNSIWNGKFLY